MDKLQKIAVFGLGSMGKRRTRILRRLFPHIEVVGIDLSSERRNAFTEEFSLSAYSSLAEMSELPQATVISTSPLAHGKIAGQCLANGLHVFTELNLSADGYADNMQIAQEKNLVLFASSTFLYRRETKYIIEAAKNGKSPLDYSYHVGQYLPDWHPWEDYRNYFVAKKESNACRELFAIELPWLAAAFGKIESVEVVSDKISKLDIPYHDNYLVTLKHHGGNKGVLIVDVVSREAVRDFAVFGEDLFVKWDGTPTGLWQKDLTAGKLNPVSLYDDEQVIHDARYSRNVIENGYENEICAYIAAIEEGKTPSYTYADDLQTLRLIDKIEEGMG